MGKIKSVKNTTGKKRKHPELDVPKEDVVVLKETRKSDEPIPKKVRKHNLKKTHFSFLFIIFFSFSVEMDKQTTCSCFCCSRY